MPPFKSILISMLLLAATAPSGLSANDAHPLGKFPIRTIGPALTSGRISDFAFHPTRQEIFYVAVSSGGVWKTVNDGISWQPVFDQQASHATGVVELDPHNPETVWVGSGENNSQRSVGFGDGVYRSLDGGSTWQNMGLKESGHISMIAFHPEKPGVVYVAAQGPLWNSGGDRGLYRTTDNGQSWAKILEIDEDTGVNEFVIHQSMPDTILASSYQRRRHTWTLINGGPGSGVHKSNDGGKTWRKITGGLPEGELGRIGLASAPSEPSIVYAIVEAGSEGKGVYRSTDFGESWEKRSGHMTSSPQYYNELVVDPSDPERVYSPDTFTHMSEDGGKTWARLSIENKHVDDHALWVDPNRSEHIIIGSDGGIFESWDRGQSWRHTQNLPIVQFYRATPDNDFPFYNVCAGTQDNHTLCGPSQTTFTDGITNADWWISQFGDGFKTRFDPENPAIVYSQYQYGGLSRFDRVTGESLSITPQPPSGQNNYKWNWSSPLIVSPHQASRLYYGAERLLRSDDRGESWVEVSPDLTRQLDRNQLEVMGRVWSVDSIAKNASTSMYGSLIALDESPLEEGLIYAGTDDGLIQVTTDGGENWSMVDSIPGVPEQSLIEDIVASSHDPAVAYAVIDNHKRGDHKPYVVKTTNRGKSWSQITGNLPERGTAHTIVEDHEDPSLLFTGTEFGLFFTQEGGNRWHKVTKLPTISVRDIEIQQRENDLVIGTFGRGIYLLDDYAPLRTPTEQLESGPHLFDVRDAWLFIPDQRRGWGGKGDFGSDRYSADNPPHGAVFTYYLPEALQTRQEMRSAAEKTKIAEGEDTPYPSWDELRIEDNEEAPAVIFSIRDSEGNLLRRVSGPVSEGVHRVAWDMRYSAPDPVNLNPSSTRSPWSSPPMGPLATPGVYTVAMSIRRDGVLSEELNQKQFALKSLSNSELVSEDPASVLEFQTQTAELYRAVTGTNRAVTETQKRIDHLLVAVDSAHSSSEAQSQAVRSLSNRLQAVNVAMSGDNTVSSRAEPVPLSITGRVSFLLHGYWGSRSSVPAGYRQSYEIASTEFSSALQNLQVIRGDLESLEEELEASGVPWTPGRVPDWPTTD